VRSRRRPERIAAGPTEAQRRALKFGSPGIGTGSHVGSEMFNLAAGDVPVNASEGIVETLASLAAGLTDYVMAPIPLAAANVQAGKLPSAGREYQEALSLVAEPTDPRRDRRR
jgi:tripartite-type tricarboxylate transporter receptor subunit TctC